MISIIENYHSLVKKFQAIEKGLSAEEIHDKRVLLRRIFPMLAAYNIKASKVKNGEITFNLFGKLRDIQVQLENLEKSELPTELIEYQHFLKKREVKVQEKVRKFSKKKVIKFPKLDKDIPIDNAKLISKVNKQLEKLIEKIELLNIANVSDIHELRVEFKKYRYLIEILAMIESIDEAKINDLKTYQDLLGEIHDYEVLMDGIKAYCKKRKLKDVDIEWLENKQNSLVGTFENDTEKLIEVCRNVIKPEAHHNSE